MLNRDRRRAGVGGVLFAISLIVGFTLFGPKGGHYSATEVTRFVEQSPTALILSVYLLVLSIVGLMVLIAYLCDAWIRHGPQGRVAWGASLGAGAAFLIGWGLYLAAPASVLADGPLVDPATSYAFLSAGMVVLFGVGGVLLGIALITLATGGSEAPGWLRAITALAGLAALASWAFLLATGWSPNQWLPAPFYLIVLWALVMGVWLLVSPAKPDTNG